MVLFIKLQILNVLAPIDSNYQRCEIIQGYLPFCHSLFLSSQSTSFYRLSLSPLSQQCCGTISLKVSDVIRYTHWTVARLVDRVTTLNRTIFFLKNQQITVCTQCTDTCRDRLARAKIFQLFSLNCLQHLKILISPNVVQFKFMDL